MTVPANTTTGPLAGTYTYGYTYNAGGDRAAVTYPDPDGPGPMTAETVTTGYDTLGNPITLTGTASYVSATSYDPVGQVASRTLDTGTTAIEREYTYDAHHRTTGWKATRAGTLIQDDRITLDKVGNVTSRRDARPSVNQRECFTYDHRNRLTRALTTLNSSCTGSGVTIGGPDPYDLTYTYSHDGRILTRNEGTGPIAYTYPTQGTGSVRPHAVTWTPLSLSVQVASVCRSSILRQVSATSAGVR